MSGLGHDAVERERADKRRFPPSDRCCSRCHAHPFDQFLPGFVVRWGRFWWAPWRTRPRFAVICRGCKAVVGWEWEPGEPDLANGDAR